ncbi:E3 ubiquitin-protein ligase RNF125 [Myotis brandtii]|uniref:E3 ubiquitin-protein ligase RNF125 n=1 Tax=Myotis brandtii TaxID=109478 RepID=S7ME68_MYOBR|nr:E3 ubiquitin-protein ligase RNF125 [Myotis brandtii]
MLLEQLEGNCRCLTGRNDFNIIEEALIRRVLDRSLLEYVSHSNTT